MSIATCSIGLDIISVCNGEQAFLDGDFLSAHLSQPAHHIPLSNLSWTFSRGLFHLQVSSC